MLVAFSVLAISLYAYRSYAEARQQWQSAINTQTSDITDFLSLVVAGDLRYGKYFDLWRKLRSLQAHSVPGEKGALFLFDEITVLDNAGNTVGSTDPARHLLLKPYGGMVPKSSEKMGDVDADTIRTVAPILFGGERIGSIVIAFDVTPYGRFLRRNLSHFFTYLFLTAAATVMLSLILARWITRPLESVRAALPLLGSGSVMIPDLTLREDEYGKLGRAIETADKRIHEYDEQVRMHRDHLEEMVRQRTHELEAANKELEAFSYSVSHDLRAPLRAIDGFSLALIEDYGSKMDESARGFLQRVRNGAQKMGLLIDDMLQLSRVTRSELRYTEVDLSAAAEQIVLALKAGEPGRQVQVAIAPGLAARGDAGLLGILLENLLGNAWKFTKGTPEVSIEFGSLPQGRERVFFVRDNGAGFDMRYVAKLFGAFQRLHTEDEFPGTGIGLATVQRIVSRHGGRVWAEGEVRKGSCFYFVLN